MSDLYSLLKGKLRLLHKTGPGWAIAACPVHKGGKERNPSFSVNLRDGSYRCFSCQIKGDFKDLQLLINDPLHGAVLQEIEEEEAEANDNLDEATLGMFHRCPTSLLEAGFDMSILKEHEIGLPHHSGIGIIHCGREDVPADRLVRFLRKQTLGEDHLCKHGSHFCQGQG